MKPTFFTMLLLIILCSACEKDPDVGIYLIDIDGTMKDPTEDLIKDAVTDYDGNTYNAVKIGTQVWMVENLRTTHYANGTSIPYGSYSSGTAAHGYFPDNSISHMSTYGLLYNWKAVMGDASSSTSNPSGVQGICPTGWHVPSDAEWTQLTDYVSNQCQYVCSSDITSIAKAMASTTGWSSSTNTCAVGNTPNSNNATGFCALPAGRCSGSYEDFNYRATFWSATENSSNHVWIRVLNYDEAEVLRSDYSSYYSSGCSVRCIKD